VSRAVAWLGLSFPRRPSSDLNGGRYLPRRREHAATERDHLEAVLAGTGFSFPRGTGPLLWLAGDGLSGKELAAELATRRIFVAPGGAWGDEHHVRIALRGPQATDRLAAALKELHADR
jgi:histidinol-phosphate/aromatic aminotransferase/cobyric acid decarboxylase-like protein